MLRRVPIDECTVSVFYTAPMSHLFLFYNCCIDDNHNKVAVGKYHVIIREHEHLIKTNPLFV